MVHGLRLKHRAPDEAHIWWDQNPEPDLVGYRIYHGTTPLTYAGQVVSLGKTPDYTWRKLARGIRHYFAVTAVNAGGQESAKSLEVSKVIP